MKCITSARRLYILAATLITVVCTTSINSQTLIQNGTFESVNICPRFRTGDTYHNWNSQMYPTSWFMPTLGTPDVISDCYNTCDQFYTPSPAAYYPQVCYYDNLYGCQANRVSSSHNYMGLATCGTSTAYTPNDFREYLETKLIPANGLVAGQCYMLSFYVSRADMSTRAIPIQAVLTHDSLVNHSGSFAGPLAIPSDAIFLTGHQSNKDKLGWTQVNFHFIATGGEKFLTIGFFEDEASSKIETNYGATTCDHTSGMDNNAYLNGNNKTGYYYIDDVSLYPTASAQFSNSISYSNTTLSGTFTGQNIILNGAISLNDNTTFSNCTIKCTSGTTMTIATLKTLTIDGTNISAGCDHMWNGIIGNVASTILVTNHSTISDAYTAIQCQAANLQIQNSSFLANEVDCDIAQPLNASYIKGATFDHTMPLKEPLRGVNGYGIKSIALDDAFSTFTIGGSTSADICFFHGGQYGITANKTDIIVNRGYFDGINQVAIDFQGNAPNNAVKGLTVQSSTFINNKRHIVSKHKTDLTVQFSALYYAKEHAIEWEDNHDCHLRIGDAVNAQAGNTFYGNIWTAVTAWDNKTAYTGNNTNFADDQSTIYTTIVIANNQITAPEYAAGILIGEWTFGGDASYHGLNIYHNTINSTVSGIQMYNIEGWLGTFDPNDPPVNPLPQTVNSNMIYTTTAQIANPFAMKINNTWGYEISENGVSSDNTGNYLNNGLMFDNSPWTEIRENILSAGTCIAVNNDMLMSNIHCNILANYAAGINMCSTYLRQDSTYLHGSATQQNNNATNAGIPWNEDIALHGTNVRYNKWVWNNANSFLTITYSGNTGFGSVIATTTGADLCDQILGPVYASGGDNTHVVFESNPTGQWRADYNYEIRRLRSGIGDSTIASANIKEVIHLENLMSGGNYATALSELAQFNPSNSIEQNYKTVLNIFANLQYPTVREATTTEVNTLKSIAIQYTSTAGAAVTLARAYLIYKYNMRFDDEAYRDGEAYGVAEIKTPCSLTPTSGTTLDMMDENGNALNITGTLVETDGSFSFTPQQLNYYRAMDSTITYRIYAKKGSQYTVVNKEFHTIDEWVAASPISLNLSGVSVLADTATATEYMQIDPYMQLTDNDGNMFSVGTTGSSPNTDFEITKRDGSNVIIWTKTWDGPVSGNDSATCMTLDGSGNIYVAGKVWNGRSYDYQTLKYDTDGYLVWSSLLADPEGRENTPTGIAVDPADGSVHITGTSVNSKTASFRYVHYWQCLPASSNRIAQPPQEEEQAAKTAQKLDIYPNPTSGTIYISMTGKSSGIIQMTNMTGQIVFSAPINGSSPLEIPENVGDGMYFITFTSTNDSPVVEKLILKRDK